MRTVPYPHPGEILQEEFLKPMGISQYRLAKEIHVPQRRIGEVASAHTAAHRADPELPTRTNQIPIARQSEEEPSKEVPSLEVPRVFEEEQPSDVLDIPDFLR